MKIKSCMEGMIFIVNDKNCLSSMQSRHNYLIISTPDNNDKLNMIQAMSITSMKNKELNRMEVPILLCNGYVSYVIPYNIHSLVDDDISFEKYKGCLSDTNFMSSREFMTMLMDIYLDSLNCGLVNHSKVKKQYEEYCSWFKEEYKNAIDYRDKDKVQATNTSTTKINAIVTPTTQKEDIQHGISRIIIPNNIINQINHKADESWINKLKETLKYPRFIKKWTNDQIMNICTIASEHSVKEIASYQSKWKGENSIYVMLASVYSEAKRRQLRVPKRLTTV